MPYSEVTHTIFLKGGALSDAPFIPQATPPLKQRILSSSSLYTMSYIDETRILDFALTKAFLPFSLRLQGTKRD